MPQINFPNIIAKVAQSPKCKKEAYLVAKSRLQEAKDQLIDDFNNHPVTEEIKAGPSADNISETLGGHGNLFSFIGFYAGEDPTEIIGKILKRNIRLSKNAAAVSFAGKGNISFAFRVETGGSEEEIYNETPYPDGYRSGSWARDIEKNIQGIQSYIYNEEFGSYEQSRSTSGLQAKTRDGRLVIIRRDHNFKPIKYISELLSAFSKNLKQGIG